MLTKILKISQKNSEQLISAIESVRILSLSKTLTLRGFRIHLCKVLIFKIRIPGVFLFAKFIREIQRSNSRDQILQIFT